MIAPNVRRWFNAQLGRFVPERLRQNDDDVRRARLIILFCFCSIVPGLLSVAAAALSYPPVVTLSAGAAVLIVLATPFVLRRFGSLGVATALFLSCIIAATAVGVVAEGLTSASLPWFGVFPLLAATFAGRRSGLLWAAVCLLVVASLAVLDLNGLLPANERSVELRRLANLVTTGLMLVTVLVFVAIYESLRMHAMATLARANAELAETHEKSVKTDRLASLGRMAAGVAHEINNPMTFISGNLGLLLDDLREGPLDPSLHREYVEDVLPATADGVRRVIAIINDLRRFARGDVESRVEFDLNAEVQAALRLCEPRLKDCHTDVRLGPLPTMMGLPRQLAQVTMNLVINAAQAVPRGGRIRVETESVGEEILLSVSDDGVGMSTAVQARLFEPFFTSKAPGEGTGLGLSVVHGIVEAHGGVVRVTSQPGEGSRFEVRLPRRPQPSLPSP